MKGRMIQWAALVVLCAIAVPLAYGQDTEDLSDLEGWFAGTDLLAANSTYPWAGSNLLGLTIYIARHTQHHAAEMALELTRRGLTPPDWK